MLRDSIFRKDGISLYSCDMKPEKSDEFRILFFKHSKPHLNTQYSILNTQYPILNTQYSILNTQYLILNTYYLILNT